MEAGARMVIQATSLNAAQLQFTDSASCKRWIETLPLTNLQAAQRALAEQIALVRHADVIPAELLRLLTEQLEKLYPKLDTLPVPNPIEPNRLSL